MIEQEKVEIKHEECEKDKKIYIAIWKKKVTLHGGKWSIDK